MGCGCGGAAKTATARGGATNGVTYPVTLPDGSVRNYLTEMEQQAALRALASRAGQPTPA